MNEDKPISLKKLKEMSLNLSIEEIEAFCEPIRCDARKSVQNLIASLERKVEKHRAAAEKLKEMTVYELEAEAKGYVAIAGVDEVGRGPLLGPVVAGVVILDRTQDWTGIDDSKKLSEDKRMYFYNKIVEHAISYAVGLATPEEIDSINILNATKLAMKRAIDQIEADCLLIDALLLPDIKIEQKSIVKGDAKSISIAAASILAKVTRDQMIVDLHETYPMYDLANNKGYGTDKHYDAIRKYGLIEAHRRSFLKEFI